MSNFYYDKFSVKQIIFLLIVLISTILLCIIPMGLSPIWNGEIPEHRNQYEIMADSILDGHLYMGYGEVDEKLLNMDNPYDPQKREELGVSYHWDHAFYKGKFYMYFGIAPALLTFAPYKAITGHTLTTYHATQFFAALYIIGMFILLYNICKYFFKDMKYSCYLLLASALSIASIWIVVDQPALYCTAIISGLSMAIWSLIFFLKSVYGNYKINKAIIFAIIGGLFGALTFACRPPVGLFNVIMIPMLVDFFKNYGFNRKNIIKVLLVFIPYLIIGGLLMTYNYVRFDNVFEFGQSYQLTMADQHNYLNIFSRIDISDILNYVRILFFDTGKYTDIFPFIGISGIFFNFPILLLPYLLMFNEEFRKSLKNKRLLVLYILLMILPFAVAIFDAIEAPTYGERYRLDEYYLLAILTFVGIANYFSIKNSKKNNKINVIKWVIIVISVLTIIKAMLLFFVPHDSNFTDYYKNINSEINEKIIFWK